MWFYGSCKITYVEGRQLVDNPLPYFNSLEEFTLIDRFDAV